jgi:arabinofuranosyltransferase
VQDDAYITFRTVHNFCSGYGLTWNPAERVQTSVHALWVLLLSGVYACTREIYYSSLVLSIVLALASYALVVFRIARGAWLAVIAGTLLLLSKAFVDYSTSGLENPATYLLLCLLVLAASADPSPRRAFLVSALSSLTVLNRLDLVWIVAPILCGTLLAAERRAQALKAALIGGLPLAAWALFALLYYGTLIPSPAYAKVFGPGLGRLEILGRGTGYLVDSLRRDPLTLCAVAAAAAAAAFRRERVSIALMLGVLLYLSYVVWIGGDFMSGRFLAAPFLASVVVLCRALPAHSPRLSAAALAVILALGVRALPSTLLSGPGYDDQNLEHRLFVDCRGFYFQSTGLLCTGERRWSNPGRVLAAPLGAPPLVVMDSVGKTAFSAGPGVHMVDHLALCDPLLSRLPALDREERWMPAHLRRHIPAGYLATLRTGESRVEDPSLSEYYRRIQLLTRGPLFARERLRCIAGFALGEYDRLLEAYLGGPYEHEVQNSMTLQELSSPVQEGVPWYCAEATVVETGEGLRVVLGQRTTTRVVELSLDANDEYAVSFLLDGALLAWEIVPAASHDAEAGLRTVRLDVPAKAVSRGFDELALLGRSGDRIFAVGHVRLVP